MFWDKKCKNCKSKINSDWTFCPKCGFVLKQETKNIPNENEREFSQLGDVLEMKVPKLLFKPLKAKGVSITITSDNVSPPKINVQTYGRQKPMHHEKPARIPKTTEEPETKIQKIHNRQIITLNLPDVKGLEDIEIRQLDQSIEIKAFAGDKAYFKLIPIPSNAMVNNEFKDGILKIEVVK